MHKENKNGKEGNDDGREELTESGNLQLREEELLRMRAHRGTEEISVHKFLNNS